MLRVRTNVVPLQSDSDADSPLEPLSVSERKTLAFVIAHLGAGGAQRVAVNAANALVARGFDVHIVVLQPKPDCYRLDPRVVLHSASGQPSGVRGDDADDADSSPSTAGTSSKPAVRAGLVSTYIKPNVSPGTYEVIMRVLNPVGPVIRLLRVVVTLRRQTKWLRGKIKGIEPNAVLSFLTQTNILTVLATRRLETHIVISERNDPRLQRHRPRVEFLRRVVYRWADVVTANSRGAVTAMEGFVPKEKLAFLPNPLLAAPSEETFGFAAPTVITVGRLVEQKGIDVLLAAWAKIAEALPGWRLAMVGEGPLGPELKKLAAELGIAGSIDWFGHVPDPYPMLRGAKIFVMTSRFEGTPNALLEAMACGLPAVVSDASPGPRELVGSGDTAAGIVVPVEDAEATADAVIRLARDETLRHRLGIAAREGARAHGADQAIEVWLRLLRCE